MNNNYTRIAVILDRSGSMGPLTEATITSFNKFIQEQKKQPGSAKLKLIQFDNEYLVSFDAFLPEVPELTTLTYVPRGGTALYDAQARTIKELGAELSAMNPNDRPSKVIVVTITDGQENMSEEYSTWSGGQFRISAMIKEQTEKYSWDFVFLAANQDAVAVARQFNINPNKAMTFTSSKAGVEGMARGLNNYMSSYRSFVSVEDATANSVFHDADRADALGKV